MLPVLMNYIFVLAVGIFLGTISAFEIFQRQLEQELNYYRFRGAITKSGWIRDLK